MRCEAGVRLRVRDVLLPLSLDPLARKNGRGRRQLNVLELQAESLAQGIADRAVQARGDRVPARDREEAGDRGRVRRRAARPGRRQGTAAGAAATADAGGSRHRARACGFDGAQARLSRSQRASQADPGRPAGARGVRCGRAGARRGDRRAPDGGRRQESDRDARRQVPPRQIRRHHRSRRCAARRGDRDDGARAADRAGAAATRRRSLSISGVRSSRTRPAAASTGSNT